MLTIVSGFQRCGSSLMCQMLAAGGMRVFHDPGMGFPAYETHMNSGCLDPISLNALDGRALKWLEPKRWMPPALTLGIRTIWLRRNVKEQGKSAAKFLREVGGVPITARTARVLAASYVHDEGSSQRLWQARGPVLVVRFEELLADPRSTSERVAVFLGIAMDVNAMVAQVRPRGPACLPGFLELDLIAARGLRAVSRE